MSDNVSGHRKRRSGSWKVVEFGSQISLKNYPLFAMPYLPLHYTTACSPNFSHTLNLSFLSFACSFSHFFKSSLPLIHSQDFDLLSLLPPSYWYILAVYLYILNYDLYISPFYSLAHCIPLHPSPPPPPTPMHHHLPPFPAFPPCLPLWIQTLQINHKFRFEIRNTTNTLIFDLRLKYIILCTHKHVIHKYVCYEHIPDVIKFQFQLIWNPLHIINTRLYTYKL